MIPTKTGKKIGRPKGSASATVEFLKFNADARAQYEAFRRSQGKPPASIPAPPSMGALPTEGTLPSTGATPVPPSGAPGTTPPADAFDPKGCAESLAGLSGLVCNFFLWKNKRELVNEFEIESYAKEITPFVTKYQRWFQYMVEIRAVAATGALVWTVMKKPPDMKRIEAEALEKAKAELKKEGEANGDEKTVRS